MPRKQNKPHNAALKSLGFGPQDRVVVVNADDVGLCSSTVSAFEQVTDFGLVTSGSLMVPCPAFFEAAEWCRARPQVDVGVHLTLTSEWDVGRWRPVSEQREASGLTDDAGYFHKRRESLWQHADPQAVCAEMQSQLECAVTAGLDLTHIDCHMFSVVHPKFIDSYVGLGLQHGLPPLVLDGDHQSWSPDVLHDQRISEWRERKLPLFDDLRVLLLSDGPQQRLNLAVKMFADLAPGLTCVIIHPATDSPELRETATDWRCRVADYQTFVSRELRSHIRRLGIQLIGYRELREVMRQLA